MHYRTIALSHYPTMQRIGIDFTSAVRERAGIGRYARELIRALARLDRKNRYVLLVPRDAHAELLHFDWPPNFKIVRAPLTERYLAALWHKFRVPLFVEMFTGAVDVFYAPGFLLPPTRARRAIVTIHDLSYVRLPECFPAPLVTYLNRQVPHALKRADIILADADSTRRDVNDVYGVPLEKIKTLYSGVDPRFNPIVSPESRARVRDLARGKPYLLSVSTIQPRKNYARLIEAFARLLKSQIPNSNLQLIISGARGWMFDDVFQTVERLNLRERVIFPDFVADDDLPALYVDATLFVYPSLYEGFGLPVAEALACGAPVVCSNASSLPEVAGDAALYFDPRDVDALVDAMQRALADEVLRSDLRARGFAQAQKFSWDNAARELRDYLIRE
ncbi:MAG: glycosyltransferase family 4 protein [Chloroflexi bacterium]|nr:glycosyltransferase family 4 protein [Chloroflexota bacterium]